MNKFRSFFHNGEVGGKVGIENRIDADGSQRGINLSGRNFARFQAEFFTDGNTDGRGNLRDNGQLGILNGGQQFAGFIQFVNGADGAVSRTLTAFDTRRFVENDVAGTGNAGFLAASDEFQRPNILQLLTNLGAAAALNAFRRIQNNGAGRIVFRHVFDVAGKRNFSDTEFGCQRLQFAAAVSTAGQTRLRMISQNHFDNCPSDFV